MSDEVQAVDEQASECVDEQAPATPLISDDVARDVFDQLQTITSLRIQAESTKERAAATKSELNAAIGQLEQMLRDARSGQRRLFGDSEASDLDGDGPDEMPFEEATNASFERTAGIRRLEGPGA